VVIHGNTKLSGYAFYGCGALTSVSYGGTVNRIEGSDAFAYCKKLSSFTLLEGVGKSGDAFFDCKNLSMKNVKLVDANGNDKTEYYTKTITINMATKSNPLTIKGNLAKGSIESIPDQQYTGGAVNISWTYGYGSRSVKFLISLCGYFVINRTAVRNIYNSRGNKTLTQDDYSIFGDSVNAGSGSVTITGKGNFEGTTTKYL